MTMAWFPLTHNSPIMNEKYTDDLRNFPLRFSLLDMRESHQHRKLKAA